MRLTKVVLLTMALVLSLSAREKVNINFSNLQIQDFIKLVSKVTHKNILINNTIKGKVDFVSATPVYKDELTNILISVLGTKGYTLIRDGSLYEIVRSTEAAKENLQVAKNGSHVYGALMLTQVLKVEGENVDIIASKIRHLLSKTAKLVTVKESNLILITDYPKNIETIKKIIFKIDTHNNMIVKIFKIHHTDAKVLQAKLSNIAKTLFNQKINSQKVLILVDEHINSIIIVAIEKNIQKIAALIEKLDVEGNNSQKVAVFELKNSEAKAVLASLNAIIAKQRFSDPSMKPSISSNDEINSIIVVGKPLIIDGIKTIIDKLDKEKYQVYVQVRIVNINKKNSESIGVKYGFSAGNVSPSGIYAMSANFGSSGLSNLAAKSITDYLGTIGTATKSALALGATLDFLQTNGASRDISNPSILCVNNKESSIYVGKTISISSGQTAVAGSTTSSFKREDVGLTLKIKPRTSSGDKVTLTVTTELGSVTDSGLDSSGIAIRQPVTSKQTVQTEVILRNGESIIIGGLYQKSEKNDVSKIPLLGDIPIIGTYLFSSNTNSVSRDSLVVVITPYIIDKSEKLSKLQKHLGELTIMQNEYDSVVFKNLEEKREKLESKVKKQERSADPLEGII